MSDWVVSAEVAPGAEWDAFAERQPGFTHFHRAGWRDVVADVWRHETLYLGARDTDGALGGVLPLVRVRSALFGHFLVSMPFVNYGGPLGETAAVRALVARATRLADDRGADLLELRSRVPLDLDLEVSHRKITVVLDIAGSTPEQLFKRLDSKLRSQVRRPQKEGVVVRFGVDQVAPFHAVYAHHMRDLGTPAQPLRLFERLAGAFGDDVWFGCAWLGDRPVAGGCGFRWGTEFEMTWASSLREFNRISPNMGLYWSFIERASAAGIGVFNFGRCTPDSGTHKFKRQWGSRDEPLYWYDRSRSGAVVTPSADDPRYAMGPRLWRHLPVGIANRLGPPIVRLIP